MCLSLNLFLSYNPSLTFPLLYFFLLWIEARKNIVVQAEKEDNKYYVCVLG